MISILLFFIYLVANVTGHQIDGMQNKVKEDLEIKRELKLMNKTPVKSIHTKFGYIVDCIDIKNQPAFDHPLLMNHKLQIKPNFQNRIKKISAKESKTKVIFGLERDQCPTGTVPIRRTTEDDLIRAKSYFSNILSQHTHGTHVARVTLKPHSDFGPYYGVGGTNSVYNIKVEKDQSSTSMMWVQNGPADSMDLIGIGWHVVPQLYNDDATHLFAVWTTGNFKKSGCYNLLCSCFVQTSKEKYLGGRFNNTSIIEETMVDITLSIIQDPITKDWWLYNENEHLGYFPAALFSNLTSADQVGWGGRTTTSAGASSPQMGSGLFPDLVFDHACYFKHVTYQNNFRKDRGPEKFMTEAFSDKPDCYLAEYYGDQEKLVGYSLQFGGPGGNCGD